MIAYNINPLCKVAEAYYFDFLFDQSSDAVPKSILTHIQECSACGERISHLDNLITLIEEDDLNDVNKASKEWLKLHFDHVGKLVTCNEVKPFLPGFLEPELELKISTPISVHLDHCNQCQHDLEEIRKLSLNRNQLAKLSQFLAYKDNVNTNMCQEVEAAIPAIASMALKRTNKQVLNHLCSCQDCHNKLYQYREIVLNQYLEQAAKIGRDLDVCPSPSVSDYYDYVIPYEFDPQNDQYATFRNSFVRHASACPICLTKMQQLHKTIFTIAERHISETSTIYHINCEKGCENNLPIDVQILNVEDSQKENSQNSNIANTYIQNQAEKSVSKIKSPIKIGLAIAACLLVASGLFLNISTAKAVTLEGLYATIAKIKNIHIMTFIPGNKEAIQERWISKTFNSYITKTGGESVLVDIQKKVKTIKQKDDSIKILPLSSEAVNETQNIISDSLGLMPFRYISQIPKDAQWIAVAEENLEVANDIEVYDLLWSDSFRNNKCRFFLNCETYLPYRIEFYEQIDEKSTYKLKSTKIVEYLTESNIQKVLN